MLGCSGFLLTGAVVGGLLPNSVGEVASGDDETGANSEE